MMQKSTCIFRIIQEKDCEQKQISDLNSSLGLKWRESMEVEIYVMHICEGDLLSGGLACYCKCL